MTPFVRKTSRAPGSEQPGGLRYPPVRIRPQAGAVLADREVEAGVRERRGLRVAEMDGELDAELPLEAPGALELGRRVVDPDRAGAATRQPGRDIARSAPELDRVLPFEVIGEEVELGLRHAPDAPRRFRGRPGSATCFDIFVRVPVPRLAIGGDVLRECFGHAIHGTRAAPGPAVGAGTPPLPACLNAGCLPERWACGTTVQEIQMVQPERCACHIDPFERRHVGVERSAIRIAGWARERAEPSVVPLCGRSGRAGARAARGARRGRGWRGGARAAGGAAGVYPAGPVRALAL